MTEHLGRAIQDLETQLKPLMEKAEPIMHAINALLALQGAAPKYAIGAAESAPVSGQIGPDRFYGQKLSTAVREFLLMRRAGGSGPATVNEIHTALKTGGFVFDTKDDDNARRGLRISLTKNSAIFHKLPNGQWGLLAWYPDAKPPKADVDDQDDDEPKGGKADTAKEGKR